MADSMLKKMLLPMDARSTRGILSRGKNVYRHGSNSSTNMDIRKAALRRLRDRK